MFEDMRNANLVEFASEMWTRNSNWQMEWDLLKSYKVTFHQKIDDDLHSWLAVNVQPQISMRTLSSFEMLSSKKRRRLRLVQQGGQCRGNHTRAIDIILNDEWRVDNSEKPTVAEPCCGIYLR